MATPSAESSLLGIAPELRLTIYDHLFEELKYMTKTATPFLGLDGFERSDILKDFHARTRILHVN